MVVVVLLVLLPLCLQRHIRQFEKAATVGVVVVVALMAVIIYKAVALGFPAVKRGELPVFSLKVDEHLPEAFAVLGFAFCKSKQDVAFWFVLLGLYTACYVCCYSTVLPVHCLLCVLL